MAPVRLLVVDDHPIVGEGVARLVNDTSIVVVGCVDRIEGAARWTSEPPDVVLLDLRLGSQLTGPLVPSLRRMLPGARIAIFTAFPKHAGVQEALDRGADVCLVKDIDRMDLVACVHQLAAGDPVSLPAAAAADGVGLSPQEQAVRIGGEPSHISDW